MSKILINQYYQNLDRTLQYGKSHNEQSIRNHFWHLLNDYARKLNYEVIPEVAIMGTLGKKVYPDGTVKNLWGLDIGLWESFRVLKIYSTRSGLLPFSIYFAPSCIGVFHSKLLSSLKKSAELSSCAFLFPIDFFPVFLYHHIHNFIRNNNHFFRCFAFEPFD